MAPTEPATAPPPAGGYQLGFQLTPLTEVGGLDLSGEFHGGRHKAEDDTLFKMAEENREGGNKMVAAGQYEAAIGRYSEAIMQTRALENEQDVDWTDAGRDAVRQLRAAAYLNLSLCFLKTQQWTHANNTATRALQGDKDPPDPKEDVLAPEKKAKALFRRAQAQSQGFECHEKAVEDLRKALSYAPDDKAVQQELAKEERALAKATKEADKKMAGFLSNNKKVQSGEGLFDDALRPSGEAKPVKRAEPMKIKDGLWVVDSETTAPSQPAEGEEEEAGMGLDELASRITHLKEEDPAEFAALRDQVKAQLEKEFSERDKAAVTDEAAAEAEKEGGAEAAST